MGELNPFLRDGIARHKTRSWFPELTGRILDRFSRSIGPKPQATDLQEIERVPSSVEIKEMPGGNRLISLTGNPSGREVVDAYLAASRRK